MYRLFARRLGGGAVSLTISLSAIVLVPSGGAAQEGALEPVRAAPVTIAVVQDGPAPGDTVLAQIEAELSTILSARGERATFKRSPEFDAGWRADRMKAALQAALDDPEVEYVVTSGPLTLQAAVEMELTKPVISAYVQRLDLFKVADVRGDRSGKPNLNFILIANRAEGDIRELLDMVPVDRIHVLIDGDVLDQLTVLRGEIDELAAATETDLIVVPVLTDVDAALTALGDADAAVITRMARLPSDERARLIRGLNARRIPTFSVEGHGDVHLGALAARTPELTTSTARRVAVNISELMRGASVEDLPILVSADPRLFMNAETAVEIGYRPSVATMALVTWVNEAAIELAREPLAFAQVLQYAERGNLRLAISAQDIVTAEKQRGLARSPILPQIGAVGEYNAVNQLFLEGIVPDRFALAGVRASQMIYDDATISDFRSSGRLLESTEQIYEATRLEAFNQAGTEYLRYALSLILYQIEVANLRVTQENLELAKFRTEVGYSGRDEVYRWEAEVAKRQSRLFASLSRVETERIRLNQILALRQDRRWQPQEVSEPEDQFPFFVDILTPLFNEATELELFREMAVQFARENDPELQAIQRQIEAQDIQVGQRKRRWFLPSISAGFSWDHQIYRRPELENIDNNLLAFNLTATYPLFQGVARAYEVGRTSSELERLFREQRLTGDIVERQTRTALRQLESSYPAITFNRRQADAARHNFDLVQDKYSQGLVNVTDLLEAQNESFVSEQGAAAAVYFFLIDLVDLQRAVAWFEDDRTPEEQQQFRQRIEAALSAN
ncbi:MAG: TolC family protein [Gemmatimonadetes bacterium]|nr:TolC family protein [Gemmatimonadota bacterium]